MPPVLAQRLLPGVLPPILAGPLDDVIGLASDAGSGFGWGSSWSSSSRTCGRISAFARQEKAPVAQRIVN